MAEIKFLNLRLQNFKGIRSFSMDFSDRTNIYGRNETGKTTIVDAITWLFFNKDHLHRTSFAIKTRNEAGEEIPHLEHSVELTLLVDGVQRTIKRNLKEKWTKPRGQSEQVFSGNYQEIFIDGEPILTGDYQQYISSIVPETVFNMLISPTFFLSLSWEYKRTFLQKVAGDITDEMITGGDEKFKPLLETLQKQDIQAYTKHLKYCISEAKKQLSSIPIRIAEQEKALPEKKDWHDVEQRLKDAQSKREHLVSERIAQAAMTPAQGKRKQLNDEICNLNVVLNERRTAAQAIYNNKVKEQQEIYNKAIAELNIVCQTINDSQLKINSLQDKINQHRAILTKCEEDKKGIREEWSKIPPRFKKPENIGICCECGAILSPEQVAEKLQKLNDEFNTKVADTKSQLRQEANAVKQRNDESTKLIQSCEEEIKSAQSAIEVMQKKAEGLKNVPALPEGDINSLLIDDEEYVKADEQIHTLQEQIASIKDDNVTPGTDGADELSVLDEEIRNLTSMLAEKVQYERIGQLIEDIKKENKDIAQHLANLEKEEDILAEYSTRKDNLLEEEVNKHFTLVKWKMFKTQVNGNRVPYCECTLKGIEAGNGLNTAGRIMAGVDIANAVSKIYGVTAPIIIDNAECINKDNFIQSRGQQIRLFVSEDEKLTIR